MGLLHLPYLVGCVFVILLFSLVGIGGAQTIYLRTFDFDKFVAEWLPQTPAAAAGFTAFYLLIFWLLYAPHYMRKQLLRAEAPISALLSNGEEDFHKLFGRLSALKPQLIVWISLWISIFAVIAIVAGGFPLPQSIELVLFLTFANIIILGFTSLVWSYFISLWGIYKMGGASLKLRSYYKDRLLGLKPVGSLALSLVAAYFAFVGIYISTAIGSPTPLPPVANAIFSGLIIPGLLMFILPLRRFHQRMLQQKKLERDRLEERLDQIYQNPSETNSPSDLSQLFFSLSISDTMKKEISAIASWPYDIQIIGRVIGITLSVLAIIIAQLVQRYLLRP